jgi:hypothetical protein
MHSRLAVITTAAIILILSSLHFIQQKTPWAATCIETPKIEKSTLSHFIHEGLRMVPAKHPPLCVMEVGSADGTGTTVSLRVALEERCRSERRAWQLYTYEGIPHLARDAEAFWSDDPSVTVVNEFVLGGRGVLDEYVIGNIEGPNGTEFPGKLYYQEVYSHLARELDGGFRTNPSCGTLDLVLIDSTRFAHAGIVQTVLQTPNLTTRDTVFVVVKNNRVRCASESPGPRLALSVVTSRMVFPVLDFTAVSAPRQSMATITDSAIP